jgi:DNA primase
MSIPNAFIQDLIARADVVDIVGKHVKLKKGGANFMGLCPFHSEKSPSFTVSPSKQFYHCFGCGKNGNAISFLMDYLGMNFVEAVEDLAQQMGMQVPQEERSPLEQARMAHLRAQQSSLNAVLEKAAAAFKQQLKASPKAIAYLERRGLSGKIAARFGLGYAPPGWRFLANVFPDYSAASLVECGLVIHATDEAEAAPARHDANESTDTDRGAEKPQTDKRYDRFRERVMFPIRSIKGEVIGFGGRVLGDEKPKYLNSPETPVFHKGQELYGLFEGRDAIRERGYVLVTEGYMDVVALAQLGFANAVATLGTACTPDHVRKLFRFSDHVVFAFDGDAAGQRAAGKALAAALPYATDTRSAKFLFLPQEHDPDSYIRAHGPEGFEAAVQQSVPLSRYLLDSAAEGCDLDTAEGRALMSSRAEPLWALLPDGAFKRQLLAEISQKVGLSLASLNELWQHNAATAAAVAARHAPSQPTAPGQALASGADAAMAAPPWDDVPFDTGAYARYSASAQAQTAASAPAYQSFGNTSPTSKWQKGPDGRWSRKPIITQPPLRQAPMSRKDNALRLVLGHPKLWDHLGHAEHDMLCQLPAPHGDMFKWIDTQHHDQGIQPWSAVQLAISEFAWAPLAMRLMRVPMFEDDNANELENEWRDTLLRIESDQLKAQCKAIEHQAETDPSLRQEISRINARIAAITLQLITLATKR